MTTVQLLVRMKISDDDDDDNNINKHLDTREVSIRTTLVSIQIDNTDNPNNNCIVSVSPHTTDSNSVSRYTPIAGSWNLRSDCIERARSSANQIISY